MEEKFTPTIEWMQEHYDKFNSLYFKNVLPHCEIKCSPQVVAAKARH